MQDINAWLSSDRNYDIGYQLYNKYGKSTFLKDLLSAGPSIFNIQKLEAELIALAPAPPAILPFENVVNEVQPKADLAAHKKYLEIKSNQRLKYRQIDYNKAILFLTDDQEILHQTAKQILKLDDEIREMWMIIDHYDSTGTFPWEKQKSEPTTPEVKRLMSQVSRAKNRLKSPSCRNAEETQKLIDDKLKRIEQIRRETSCR